MFKILKLLKMSVCNDIENNENAKETKNNTAKREECRKRQKKAEEIYGSEWLKKNANSKSRIKSAPSYAARIKRKIFFFFC